MRYSVKPVTKREHVLYQLITTEYVPRRKLIRELGNTAEACISEFQYRLKLTIMSTRIGGQTFYTLLSFKEGWELYEKWCVNRQNETHIQDMIWLEWSELLKTVNKIALEYNMSVSSVSNIISRYLKNKLAQVNDKL